MDVAAPTAVPAAGGAAPAAGTTPTKVPTTGAKAPAGGPPNQAPDGLKPAGSAPAESKTPEAPKPPEKRKYKIPGKTGREVELSDDEVSRKLAASYGIEERIRRAEEMERKNSDFMESLKSRGVDALYERAKDVGLDEASLNEQMEQRMLRQIQRTHDWDAEQGQWVERSPESRELMELREFREQQMQLDQQRKAREVELERQRAIEATTQQYVREMQPILKKLGYNDDHSRTMVMPIVSDVLQAADAAGVQLTTEQAVSEAREMIGDFVNGHLSGMAPQDFQSVIGAALNSRLSNASGADIAQLIGNDSVKKILDYTLERMGRKPAAAAAPAEPKPAPRKMEKRDKEEALSAMVFGRVRN